MLEAGSERALTPPRAFGSALGHARLRVEPEDFVVEEDLGFAPSGAGSHVLLRVRKRNANTEWVARELARAAGCRPGDVGFAGLKDRHAVTTQWFSVPVPRKGNREALNRRAAQSVPTAAAESTYPADPSGTTDSSAARRLRASPGADGSAVAGITLGDLASLRGNDYEVLDAHLHAKKLPRGALAGNRFTIRVRDLRASDEQLTERLNAIASQGVPNYFGPQRFGRDGANLRKITPDPNGVHPRERTYVFSAARSLIFNAVLAERVAEGSWRQLETGDVANLDARGSVFPVDAVDESLQERAARQDLHPTGPMWGDGELMSRGRIQSLEQRIAADYPEACTLVIAAGMHQERRSLRLAVRELDWSRDGADVVLRFWLTRGSYATTVLRELIETDDSLAAQDESP
jgi:tRNA pseudouridine13 synthase